MRLFFLCVLLVTTLATMSWAQEHKITVQKFEPPLYPPIARQANIEGEVKLALSVSAKGEVLSARVLSGNPMLVQAAMDNVKKWRFHCDNCAYAENFDHEIRYVFAISSDDIGYRRVEYNFPGKVIVNAEPALVEGNTVNLPRYFWLWKLLHPRYWHFHGFE